MSRPRYPAATTDNLPILAQLLAERGVEVRLADDGTLLVRDRDKSMSPADRTMVRHYAEPLARWLRSNPNKSEHLKETRSDPKPAERCDRCHSPGYRDVPIHAGQSLRRECARCGRTRGFARWYGVDQPID